MIRIWIRVCKVSSTCLLPSNLNNTSHSTCGGVWEDTECSQLPLGKKFKSYPKGSNFLLQANDNFLSCQSLGQSIKKTSNSLLREKTHSAGKMAWIFPSSALLLTCYLFHVFTSITWHSPSYNFIGFWAGLLFSLSALRFSRYFFGWFEVSSRVVLEVLMMGLRSVTARERTWMVGG